MKVIYAHHIIIIIILIKKILIIGLNMLLISNEHVTLTNCFIKMLSIWLEQRDKKN